MRQDKSILFLVTEDWYFVLHRLPIARAALQSGYEVLVATQLSGHQQLLEQEGFRVIPMEWRRSSMNPFTAFNEIRQIINIYRKFAPDLVHHVALKPSLYGSAAARWLGISPVVNNLAGLGQAFSATGAVAGLIREGLVLAFRLFFRRRHTCTIVENSDDQRFLVTRVGMPASSAVLIRGIGVNEQDFAYCPEQKQSVPVVTMVSRLLWPKGVAELVEAGRILRARGLEIVIRLVGEPDAASRVSVPEDTLRGWHEAGAVEWLGYQDNIPAIWAQASIAVLPSYYREGIPRSLLEAASCGRPLVATDMPGCREIVMDGVNGFLVPPRDAAALADALEKLIRDAGLRERMGRAGREMVLKDFTERLVVGQTLGVYHRLLDQGECG